MAPWSSAASRPLGPAGGGSSVRIACSAGLRITVYDVLDYLASGMSEAEILLDFPDLIADDLRACLAFAADRERKLDSVPLA